MDEDLVALLAIPVLAWAAYVGLPLLDPPSIRARSARPQPQPPGSHRPRPQPQPQNQPQNQNQNQNRQAESFAQKAAQRRATRIGR
jgi:hypothetical protein